MTLSSLSGVAASPAHAPLERFVGEWATEGVLRQTHSQAAGRMEATDTYEWLPGGYFLLHRWDAHFPDNRTQGIEVVGYDSTSGDFFMQSFDSTGNTGVMRATVDGDSWTFSSETLRFKGGFREEGSAFSGLWEQRTTPEASWTPWMDITLLKVR